MNYDPNNHPNHHLNHAVYQRLNTFILYDAAEPIHISSNLDDGFELLKQYCARKIKTAIELGRPDCIDVIERTVHLDVISHTMSGICVSNKRYFYDHNEECVAIPSQDNWYSNTSSVYDPQKQRLVNSRVVDRLLPITTHTSPIVNSSGSTSARAIGSRVDDATVKKISTRTENFGDGPSNQGPMNAGKQYNTGRRTDSYQTAETATTQTEKSSIMAQNEAYADRFREDMRKLVSNLDVIAESQPADVLEDIYDGVGEEALLDEEIRKLKKDIPSDDEESDEYTDYDLISEGDLDKRSESEETSDNDQLEVNEDMPDELKTLICARNELKSNISHQALIVDKANEKLNEELFEKRCIEQEKRRQEQKKQENISIYKSDKNTYLKIRSRIKREVLQEKNISPLFRYKYHIFSFMEQKELIEFTKTADIEKEQHIFSQLQKVFDMYENNECVDDSDGEDPVDEIDSRYMDICMEYLELLEASNGEIVSEKVIHTILNENPEIKSALFREAANTDVFEKDTNKEDYTQREG